MSNFKADILKEVGRVAVSPDLEHRVLIVRDEEGRTKVSMQVWWREGDNTWHPGKGYFLNGRRAISLARMMKEVLPEEGKELTSHITNTQKHVVYNKNRIVAIDKWWRKDDTEDWTFGKSVAINIEKAEELSNLLHVAGTMIIHTK